MALRDISDQKLFVVLRRLPQTISLISLVLLAGMYIRWWPLEIIISVLPQLMILIAGLFMLLFTFYSRFIIRDGWSRCKTILGIRDIVAVGTALALAMIVLVISLRIIRPLVLTSGSGHTIKLATYNKFIENDNLTSVTKFFEQMRPDIIGLQEIHIDEASQIQQALSFDHIYSSDCQCSAEDSDVFVISKFPITNASTIYQHPTGAVVRVEINSTAGPVAVYVAHVPGPFTPESFGRRVDVLDSLKNSISSDQIPVLVMGDFNLTIYSPDFRSFAGDIESKAKYVAIRNWPRCSWHGLGDPVCLRIDHIFIPKTANLKDFIIGEYAGSDHRPVWASIQL